jgi:hypothetical protein
VPQRQFKDLTLINNWPGALAAITAGLVVSFPGRARPRLALPAPVAQARFARASSVPGWHQRQI